MALRSGENPGQDLKLSRRHFAAMAPAAVLGASGLLPRLVTSAAAQPADLQGGADAGRAGQGRASCRRWRSDCRRSPWWSSPNAVGTYGGTLLGAALAPEMTSDLQIGMDTGLFRFSNDLSESYPELATGYEFSPDYTSCTITLRKASSGRTASRSPPTTWSSTSRTGSSTPSSTRRSPAVGRRRREDRRRQGRRLHDRLHSRCRTQPSSWSTTRAAPAEP